MTFLSLNPFLYFQSRHHFAAALCKWRGWAGTTLLGPHRRISNEFPTIKAVHSASYFQKNPKSPNSCPALLNYMVWDTLSYFTSGGEKKRNILILHLVLSHQTHIHTNPPLKKNWSGFTWEGLSLASRQVKEQAHATHSQALLWERRTKVYQHRTL